MPFVRLVTIRLATTVITTASVVLGLAAPVAAQEATLPPAAVAGVTIPKLEWRSCSGPNGAAGFECASAHVPLDYDEPKGRAIELALIRLPASDPARRLGSVFINFGGPGGPGVPVLPIVTAAGYYSEELRARFDLVSFDPRGVGASTPVQCFATAEEQERFYVTSRLRVPVTREEQDARAASDAEFASRCGQRAGELLDHVSTADVARDLDLLRAAVGDKQLYYIGYSYGTFIGATYAALFSNRPQSLVLDGVVDPEDYVSGAKGTTTFPRTDADISTNATFNEFLRLCGIAGPQCAFNSPNPAADFGRIVQRLRQAPIEIPGAAGAPPTTLEYGILIGVTTVFLYNPATWILLAQFLAVVRDNLNGIPTPLPDEFTSSPADSLGNTLESQLAVLCTDTDEPTEPDAWFRYAAQREQRASEWGRYWTYVTSPCASWPGDAREDRYTGPFAGNTATPPLIIGTQFDPATPYESSVELYKDFSGSGLITVEGWGHTGSGRSECVDDAVTRYLVDGSTPTAGITCQLDPDSIPFATPIPSPPQPLIGPLGTAGSPVNLGQRCQCREKAEAAG